MWKIITAILILFLAANFCWHGKPLYLFAYHHFSKSVSGTVEDIKETGEKQVEKAKEYVEKGVGIGKEPEKKAEEKKDEKKPAPSEFSKEDRDKVDNLIKQKTKK